jgi:hypothetical protein
LHIITSNCQNVNDGILVERTLAGEYARETKKVTAIL